MRIDPNDKDAVDRKIRELSAEERPPLVVNMPRGTKFVAVARENGGRLHLEFEYQGDGVVASTTTYQPMPASAIDQSTVRNVEYPA